MNAKVLRAIEAHERYDRAYLRDREARRSLAAATTEMLNAWNGLTVAERKALQAAYDSRLPTGDNER